MPVPMESELQGLQQKTTAGPLNGGAGTERMHTIARWRQRCDTEKYIQVRMSFSDPVSFVVGVKFGTEF